MRKFLLAGKTFFAVLLSAACALFLVFALRAPVFGGGEGYEVYYGASSSAPFARTDRPLYAKLTGAVRGESARFRGDLYEELKARFRAELLFSRKTGEVTDYYLYSEELGGGVMLEGRLVNLHIATDGETTAAGTPLIFGGY